MSVSARVACRHCAEILAGPADYVDAPVAFRQYCCPGCWTALYSAVVPAGHTDTMTTLDRWSR